MFQSYLFGLFQINGVNSYSIPSFVALLVSWQLYKMYSWEDNAKDLNEENREKFEQKNISKTWIWITSAIIWIACIIGFISMSVEYINNSRELVLYDSSSDEVYENQSIEIDDFNRLEIEDAIKVVLIQDSTSKIEFTKPRTLNTNGGMALEIIPATQNPGLFANKKYDFFR